MRHCVAYCHLREVSSQDQTREFSLHKYTASTVIITDTQGRPVQGAEVLAETTMLDMDMGTDVLQLQADSSSSLHAEREGVGDVKQSEGSTQLA